MRPASAAASVVGSWLYTVTSADAAGNSVFLGTETDGADGTYTEADQLSFKTGFLATPGTAAGRPAARTAASC